MTERLPQCCCDIRRHKLGWEGQTSPVRRQRILARTVIVALVLIGLIAIARGVHGAEPRTWVIWDAVANRQFHPHQFTSVTACNVDIAHAKDGSGRRLACVRIDKGRE